MVTLETLNKEAMESVKELSQITLKISEGKAVLSELKEGTAIYLKEREEEALKAVKKALVDSEDMLIQIGVNRQELTNYKNDIANFAHTTHVFFKGIEGVKEALDKSVKDFDIRTEKVIKEINEEKLKLKVEHSAIKSERESLARDSARIQKETRLLNDRRETLERGFKELRRLSK